MRIAGCLLLMGMGWILLVGPGVGGKEIQTSSTKPFGLGMPAYRATASATCAAAACHGNGTVGSRGGEYTTWAPDLDPTGPTDPHANSYRALFNGDSARMVRLLRLKPAYKEPLCLACHSVPGIHPARAVSEGVGCAACHGPSEKWLAVHHQPSWKRLSDADKWEQYGFVPSKNLTARLVNCAGCHIGKPGREVNHELLAAGHPRLAFEAARHHFHPGYRKHWVEIQPQPGFEVRLWVIGQAVAARSAAALLEARARRAVADPEKVAWPEFAGQSCYACHKTIVADNTESRSQPRSAQASWDPWSTSATPIAARYSRSVLPDCLTPSLKAFGELRQLMDSSDVDPAKVAQKAAAAIHELDIWLTNLQNAEVKSPLGINRRTPLSLTHWLARNVLNEERNQLRTMDWDRLAAHSLGVAAMTHSLGGPTAMQGFGSSVPDMWEALRFPPARGKVSRSPRGIGEERFIRIEKAFRELAGRDLGEKP